jgi:hypothetical protein
LSPPAFLPNEELVEMVRNQAEVKASMPPKLRGILTKDYGVNVQVDKVFGTISYTAGSGRLMPDLRFTLKADGEILVRSYNSGDWELAVKRAHDDLVAQSGAFEGLSIKLPEPISRTGKGARPPAKRKPQKSKSSFLRLLELIVDRILGMVSKSGGQ